MNTLDQLIQCLEQMKEHSPTAAVSPEVWNAFSRDLPKVKTPSQSPVIEKVASIAITEGTVAEQWESLSAKVDGCEECPLAKTRLNTVFGEGNRAADLMFIGEGPGEDEDKQGRPFVGRAGQLLDKMIVAMGFDRSKVYIANVVKCRPPGNRTPEQHEVDACVGYLKHQIQLVNPKIIVLLGMTAIRHTVDPQQITGGITAMLGHWLDIDGIPAMPIYHPSYLLRLQREPQRERTEKQRVWNALQVVMKRLKEME